MEETKAMELEDVDSVTQFVKYAASLAWQAGAVVSAANRNQFEQVVRQFVATSSRLVRARNESTLRSLLKELDHGLGSYSFEEDEMENMWSLLEDCCEPNEARNTQDLLDGPNDYAVQFVDLLSALAWSVGASFDANHKGKLAQHVRKFAAQNALLIRNKDTNTLCSLLSEFGLKDHYFSFGEEEQRCIGDLLEKCLPPRDRVEEFLEFVHSNCKIEAQKEQITMMKIVL